VQVPPPAPAPAGRCPVHRVVRGDTLWALSARRFGDPLRWPEIFAANRDALASPHRILPGEELRIPDRCDVTRF
jgi:nucleoid-associated protein YgaU